VLGLEDGANLGRNLIVPAQDAGRERRPGVSPVGTYPNCQHAGVIVVDRRPSVRSQSPVGRRAYLAAADKNKAFNAIAQIFGERMGPQMMTMLRQLAEQGFPAVEASARKAGDVMSAETVAALNKAEKAIQEFKNRITVAVGNIIVNFRTEEGMKLLLYRFLEIASAFGGKIIDALWQADAMIGSVLKGAFIGVVHVFQDTLVEAVERAAKALNKVLPKRMELHIADLDKFKSDGEYVGSSISRAIAETKPTKFSEEFSDYWKKLGDAQQLLVNQVNKIDLGKPAKQLTDAGKDMQASADATASAITTAAEKVKKILMPKEATLDAGAMKLVGGMRTYFSPIDQMREEQMQVSSAKKDTQDEINALNKMVSQYRSSGSTEGRFELPALLARIKALEGRQSHLKDYVFNPNYADSAGQGIMAAQVATIGDPLKLQNKQTDALTKVANGVTDLNERLRVAGLSTTPTTSPSHG
jgi:hypothetical protein